MLGGKTGDMITDIEFTLEDEMTPEDQKIGMYIKSK